MTAPKKAGFVLKLIYFLLACLVASLIYSVILATRIQNEIDKDLAISEKNFLSYSKSLNRLVFTLNDLLSYDENSKSDEMVVREKLELLRAVVSNADYIQNLSPVEIAILFDDDPLLIEQRLEDQSLLLQKILAELEFNYNSAQDTSTQQNQIESIEKFEQIGRRLMKFLKAQNYLMSEIDDYLYSHLQNDLKDTSGILRSVIIIYSFFIIALLIFSFLYFSIMNDANRKLINSRDHLEELVNERTQDLRTKQEELKSALSEREYLLKEVHHRVKNNLFIIENLVNLQRAGSDDPEFIKALGDIISRIHSISLLHRKIYQSDSLSKIDFREYVLDLSESIIDSFTSQDIELDVDIIDIQFDSKSIVPLGIIIAELITNAIKYGFKEKESGRLSFNLKMENEMIIFKIFNDGIPFPENLDISSISSLGLKLVQEMVKQINGNIELDRSGGTLFVIKFPYKDHNQV